VRAEQKALQKERLVRLLKEAENLPCERDKPDRDQDNSEQNLANFLDDYFDSRDDQGPALAQASEHAIKVETNSSSE